VKIGVLALQGDFDAHRRRLEELGAEVVLVKKPEQLDQLDGLIIPGGESGTFLKLLGEEVKRGLRIRGIPTSDRSRELAESLGIPLTTLDECQEIAVTVDGADEVDPQLRLIKGGGGAMLREKIVASATRPLPVEVIGFAQALVAKRIRELGAEVSVRTDAAGKTYVTDEGHHILDCRFGQIRDADTLARQLNDMPGVVEHGLFIGMASVVLFARGDEIVELRR